MRAAPLSISALAVIGALGCKQPYRALPTTPPASATPPPPTVPPHLVRQPTDLVRFVVFGDYGWGGDDEAAVAALVTRLAPDFVATTGDNNYPAGAAETIDDHIGRYYAPFIGSYKGAFGPGAPVNRFFPAAGNHDWMSGLGPYLDYFTLPGNERYYDVDKGIVRLWVLDTDAAEPDGVTATSKQAAWLSSGLATSRACFDLVTGHHPPWSSSLHGGTEAVQWPFAAWGVEAAFFGHDHVYERIDGPGLPLFTIGLGGAPRYPFQAETAPNSRVRYNARPGVILVSASATEMTFELYDVDARRIDAYTIKGRCPP